VDYLWGVKRLDLHFMTGVNKPPKLDSNQISVQESWPGRAIANFILPSPFFLSFPVFFSINTRGSQ